MHLPVLPVGLTHLQYAVSYDLNPQFVALWEKHVNPNQQLTLCGNTCSLLEISVTCIILKIILHILSFECVNKIIIIITLSKSKPLELNAPNAALWEIFLYIFLYILLCLLVIFCSYPYTNVYSGKNNIRCNNESIMWNTTSINMWINKYQQIRVLLIWTLKYAAVI